MKIIIKTVIVFIFGIGLFYGEMVSGFEGESMPDVIVWSFESPYIIEPPADAIVINFDDVSAPKLFGETTALRDLYAAQGVSFDFDVPDTNHGGAILNEDSGFLVDGYTQPNFLAFNTAARLKDNKGIPQGPEIISFEQAVNHVQANVGSGSENESDTITMEAYDESDQLLVSETVNYKFELQTLSVEAPGITKVIVSFTGTTLVLDDLAFVQEKEKRCYWGLAYNVLFDRTSDLDTLREYRDEILSKRARGRLYKKLLYKNSEDALEVLLDNPELMSQARHLFEANKDAVIDVLNGDVGVIHNTDEIIAFLKAFAKKSPPRLKALAKVIKKGMLRKKRKGKLFLGFRLK